MWSVLNYIFFLFDIILIELLFKTIFETLSALGACHVTIIEGVVYKKFMICEVFGVYLSEFLIFLHEILFGSKILPNSCDKHQTFDYGCTRYSGNEAQSSDFGHFLAIWGIFRAVCFRHKSLA